MGRRQNTAGRECMSIRTSVVASAHGDAHERGHEGGGGGSGGRRQKACAIHARTWSLRRAEHHRVRDAGTRAMRGEPGASTD